MQADLFPSQILFSYLESQSVKETPQQKKLKHQVEHLELATMQISPLQSQLLRFIIKLCQPKLCLEIGTYCGYSAMVIAQSLPETSHLHTCDINHQTTQLAQNAWREANIDHKITLHLQPAIKTLLSLQAEHKGKFDFIFIDGDKTNYPTYFLLAKDLLRQGGLMIIDNITWHGQVCQSESSNRQLDGIKRCNSLIKQDNQITSCIIPLGDGMFFINKN